MLLDSFSEFLSDLTLLKALAYFWPFFLIDMSRYLLLDFIVLIFYIPKRYRKRHAYAAARRRLFRERPLISVIVPGKNEGKHLAQLARTLTLQSYKNIESIIVDDGSDDETPLICRRLLRQGKITRFFRNEIRGGKASAANTALRYVRGKYVIHLDADSHLSPDAIEKVLLPFYMDDRIGAVGGDIRVANVNSTLATRFQTIEYFKTISTGRTVSSELGILRIIGGAFGAFRTDILQRLYGWDVGPGLDGDITMKIRKLGYKVAHEPFAVCYTNVPDSFRKLARQRFRWNRSLVRFRLRKHRDILLPSKNFNFRNFLASFDNIFFNLLLNMKWWLYLAQLLIIDPGHIEIIILINLLLYGLANILEFGIAVALLAGTMYWRELVLFIYLPLIPLYTGFYIRSIRSLAYLLEFVCRVSYFDKWNPWKVSNVARNLE